MATTFASLILQARRHLIEQPGIATPSAPVVTPTGTTGATSYSYKIVGANKDQTSVASSAGSTTTGNASLSSTNFNRVTWTASSYATYYYVYRTVGGATTGVIAVVGAGTLQLDDTGLTGDAASAPTLATGGTWWTDAELLDIAINGVKDMWAAIIDVFGDHYLTIDVTNVSLAASGTSLTGVPTDVFRVHLIEPRDTTSAGASQGVRFVPRKYNHPDFMSARSLSALDPATAGVIFYDVSGAGSPIAAPTILTAPLVNAAISLRFVYVPTLPTTTYTTASSNPIPGESDQALIAYIVAFARAKERDDRSVDPNWVAVYATEKQSILTRATPRQEQEPDVVEGLFDDTFYN